VLREIAEGRSIGWQRWFVLAQPIELSAEQIAKFAALYDDNNRPTQPLRGRSLVLEKVE
jgi:carbonic anhydrase